jgi:hypothetical protein
MGFQQDMPIVTAAEVEAHTHETDLGLLDQANATVDSLRAKATNAIVLALKLRGVDPAQVANVDDFKFLASWWIVGTIYASKPQGDEENTKKADFYLKKFEDGVRSIFVEGQPGDSASIGPPVPRAFHLDQEPNFARPTRNRRPGRPLWPFWRTM